MSESGSSNAGPVAVRPAGESRPTDPDSATSPVGTPADAGARQWRAWRAGLAWLTRPVAAFRWVVRRWRESLQLRVVTATVLLGMLVVTLVGGYIYSEIAHQLEDQRIIASQYEARTLTQQAQRLFDNATPGQSVDALNTNASDIMRTVLTPPGSTPGRYVVMARSVDNRSPVALAYLQSGEIGLTAVRVELREAVAADPTTQQTQITPVLLDGEQVPAVMVGSAVLIPTAGYYDLYFIYPMTQELLVMGIISNAFVLGGAALILLVGAIAWIVARQVVTPVRRAAVVAERLASGQLNERMSSHGADDLARLGTSFNAMADSLQTQIRQLEELSQVQQRFVSDVSHELRTPLTTIRMASGMINDVRQGFDPVVARSAELLEGELDRFEALLADLLEISRFDAGAAVLDLEPVDLSAVTRRAMEMARPIAVRRGSPLTLHVPAEPAVAEFDERRVERILRNLIVNAIEHGEGNPVDVHVAKGPDAVSVVVADHGVGLRPGEASMVFNRFWRADPARARTTGGTGLGLSIALEDARLHNGWLQAWGEHGVGSRFRLTLPLTADHPIGTAPLPLEPGESS